jgi:hypothetical protein
MQEEECSLLAVRMMILDGQCCPCTQAPRRECVCGSGGIAPRILNLITRWRWVVILRLLTALHLQKVCSKCKFSVGRWADVRRNPLEWRRTYGCGNSKPVRYTNWSVPCLGWCCLIVSCSRGNLVLLSSLYYLKVVRSILGRDLKYKINKNHRLWFFLSIHYFSWRWRSKLKVDRRVWVRIIGQGIRSHYWYLVRSLKLPFWVQFWARNC